jgi:site-specific DNA-methyltransferase (adenine-specific)
MINLMLGDCLERMAEIPDGSVDMVLTDPPYGTTACKWDAVIPFEPMWDQLKRVTKGNGVIVMTASQPFTSALVMSNVAMFKYCWVWEKSKASNFLQAAYMPLKAHEDVVVFSQSSKTTYNPQMVDGTPYSGEKRAGKKGSNSDVVNNVPNPTFRRGSPDGKRKPRTVQYFKTPESEGKTHHPTQKPVALMEYLIRTYTNEGETVLDFTMGSGTTGVACVKTGRNFIGIERDEGYFKVADDRIKEAKGQV